MGWCSGTEIFDDMCDVIFDTKEGIGINQKYELIKTLIISLENQDWDCQSDSEYYNDPIVENVFKKLHPDWFDSENSEDLKEQIRKLTDERNQLASIVYECYEDYDAKVSRHFVEQYEKGYYK